MSHDRSPGFGSDIPREWSQPSDIYGWGAVLQNALPYFALLALAPVLAQRRASAPWLLSPLIGLFGYRLTLVMHDCIHRSLFQERKLNLCVGTALGAITGIDFQRFASQHRRHHRQVGQPDDPQGFHYLKLGASTPCERLWHLLKPLVGLNLPYALPESFAHPSNLARALRRGEGLLVAGTQIGITVLVTGGGRHLILALLPFVSAATFGLFLSQLRGIAEHAAIEAEQVGCVRTHAPHWLDRILLYGLNFNYHEEHHRYPHIPSHRLADVNTVLDHAERTHHPSMLQTIARILVAEASTHAK